MNKLLILLKARDELHMIDEVYDDKENLEQLAKDRKENNPDYLPYLMEYDLVNATLI